MNAFIVRLIVNGIVLPFIFMLCWNYSFHTIFTVSEINFLQSFLINIMFNIVLRKRQNYLKDEKEKEQEIKQDIEKIEVLFEKYTERIRGVKSRNTGEKENEQ